MFRRLIVLLVLVASLAMAAQALAQQRGQQGGASSPPAAGQAQGDRARDRAAGQAATRDREQARVRDPALHVQERDRLRDRNIYGSGLMTRQERVEYRERIRNMSDDSAWARFQLQHQQAMQARARERGVEIEAPFYGQHMMTSRERIEHRRALDRARSEQERARIRAEHQTAMQERARALGLPQP